MIYRCIGLLLSLLSAQAAALSTDKDQPVSIEADSVDIDEANEIAIYRGKVILTQGSIKLDANRVVVHQFQSDNAYLVATGGPVHFSQRPDNDTQLIKGAGKKVEYALNSSELVLTGDASLIKGKNTFRNDRIIYDRKNARVKAGASAKGKERVRITISPDRK